MSSGTRMYLIVFPRMKASFIFQNLSPSLLVQMTSFRWTFIHVSHWLIVPLKVSPFLSSTSYTTTSDNVSNQTKACGDTLILSHCYKYTSTKNVYFSGRPNRCIGWTCFEAVRHRVQSVLHVSNMTSYTCNARLRIAAHYWTLLIFNILQNPRIIHKVGELFRYLTLKNR